VISGGVFQFRVDDVVGFVAEFFATLLAVVFGIKKVEHLNDAFAVHEIQLGSVGCAPAGDEIYYAAFGLEFETFGGQSSQLCWTSFLEMWLLRVHFCPIGK